jgi:hypothetical protein
MPILCRKHSDDSSNDDVPRPAHKHQRRIVDTEDEDEDLSA